MEKVHPKNKTKEFGRMKKGTISTIFKVVVSLAILSFLFRETSFDEKTFYQTISKLNLTYFILSLPFVLILLALKSYRWKLIIDNTGVTYPFKRALQAYFSAFSLGIVTPGRLGELLKVYNLRQDIASVQSTKAFQTVVVDRLFDMVFLVWFGFAAALFYGSIFTVLYVLLPASLVVIVISIFFSRALLQFLKRKWLQKSTIILFLIQCLDVLLSKKSWPFWLISAIAYAFFFLGIKVLFLSLGISMGFFESGFIISLIGLVLLLPISVAGFGTREAGLVYLLSFYGLSPETAISFSLLQFTVFFLWGGIVGLIFWLSSPIPLSSIRKDSEKIFSIFTKRQK